MSNFWDRKAKDIDPKSFVPYEAFWPFQKAMIRGLLTCVVVIIGLVIYSVNVSHRADDRSQQVQELQVQLLASRQENSVCPDLQAVKSFVHTDAVRKSADLKDPKKRAELQAAYRRLYGDDWLSHFNDDVKKLAGLLKVTIPIKCSSPGANLVPPQKGR